MAKLYFKYGAMGSSKTAQALITKFNYEEGNSVVWLIKPSIDTRDGVNKLRSRIGLESDAQMIAASDDLVKLFHELDTRPDVVIADEAQFLTEVQVEQLRRIVDREQVIVMCYGLKTDFQNRLFPGSKRLFELSESISEIKSVCACGTKASVNARLNSKGEVMTEGEQVVIGGNEAYKAMCYQCYDRAVQKATKKSQ